MNERLNSNDSCLLEGRNDDGHKNSLLSHTSTIALIVGLLRNNSDARETIHLRNTYEIATLPDNKFLK